MRDTVNIFVGFAYFIVPQHSEITSKFANPTRSVEDRRFNPTYDLSFRSKEWIPLFNFYLCVLRNLRYFFDL